MRAARGERSGRGHRHAAGISFDTIAGAAGRTRPVHYPRLTERPTRGVPGSCSLDRQRVGQYEDGHHRHHPHACPVATRRHRDACEGLTQCCRAMIAIHAPRFPRSVATGAHLDALGRSALWAAGRVLLARPWPTGSWRGRGVSWGVHVRGCSGLRARGVVRSVGTGWMLPVERPRLCIARPSFAASASRLVCGDRRRPAVARRRPTRAMLAFSRP